jgi:hypothetical protein
MTRAGWLVLAGVVLTGAEARAACAVVSACICDAAGTLAVAGHITRISGGTTTVVVDTSVGAQPDAGQTLSELSYTTEAGEAVGGQVIVGLSGSTVRGVIHADASGTVGCSGKTFTTPQTLAALVAPDCASAVAADGLPPVPCDSSGCQSATGPSLLALLLLGGRRRRLG